jgi:hypothetical protein
MPPQPRARGDDGPPGGDDGPPGGRRTPTGGGPRGQRPVPSVTHATLRVSRAAGAGRLMRALSCRADRLTVHCSPPPPSAAATVSCRKSSDWRHEPTRPHFISAPRGVQQQPGLGTPVGETLRTSKPRPAVRARRRGAPARTRAQREHDGAHRERRGSDWRPGPTC